MKRASRVHLDQDALVRPTQNSMIMWTNFMQREPVKAACGAKGYKLFLTRDDNQVTCKRCL